MPGLAPGAELLAELRPYVRQCGNAPRGPWRMKARRLLDYLLVYIEEGRGRFSIGEVEYDAEPGDLFWIPPDTVHTMEGDPPLMVCPYMHFDLVYRPNISHWDFSIPEGMTDLAELRPLLHPDMSHTPFGALPGRLRMATNERIGQLINEIVVEATRAHPYANLRMSGLLMEVLAEILRGRAQLPLKHSSHIPQLEAAAERLRHACHEGIAVEDAARQCRLSPSYFRKLFQLHFGYAPREYLRRQRMQRAKQMMMASALNVSEIAEACGFASVHSFSRAFHATEGIAPSAYRRCDRPSVRVDGRKAPYSH